QTQRGQRGILHRRRSGMFDRVPKDGAVASGRIDRAGEIVRHALVYRLWATELQRLVGSGARTFLSAATGEQVTALKFPWLCINLQSLRTGMSARLFGLRPDLQCHCAID